MTLSSEAHERDRRGDARYARFTVMGASGPSDDAHRALARTLAAIDAPIAPWGPPPPAALHPPLSRLRAAAPFGALRWTALDVVDGRVELTLASDAATAVLWIAHDGRPRGGYRVVEGEADPRLVDGLRAAMRALRVGAAA